MTDKTEMDFFHILTKAHEQTNKFLNEFQRVKKDPSVHILMQCPIFHSTLTKGLKLPRSSTEFISDSSNLETDKEKEENSLNSEQKEAFYLPAVKVEHDKETESLREIEAENDKETESLNKVEAEHDKENEPLRKLEVEHDKETEFLAKVELKHDYKTESLRKDMEHEKAGVYILVENRYLFPPPPPFGNQYFLALKQSDSSAPLPTKR
jgi:hypothetical protein